MALQAQGSLSSSESEELSQLWNINQALETQIQAKERLLEIEAKQANKTGEEALNKTDISLASLYDDKGKRYVAGSKEADAHVNVQKETDAEAIRSGIKKVNEFQNSITEKKREMDDTSSEKEKESLQKEIDQLQDAMDDLEADMAQRAINLSSTLSNMTDSSSEAYQNARKALTEYNTRDMTSDKWEQSISGKDAYRQFSEEKTVIILAEIGNLYDI